MQREAALAYTAEQKLEATVTAAVARVIKEKAPNAPRRLGEILLEGEAAPSPELTVLLELEVKPECIDECIKLLTASAQGSRQEPGCVRFDVMRDQEKPNTVYTYEAFASAADMDFHKAQPHTKAWGAFQYGELKPIVSKNLRKLTPVTFDTVYERRSTQDSLQD